MTSRNAARCDWAHSNPEYPPTMRDMSTSPFQVADYELRWTNVVHLKFPPFTAGA